MATIRQRLGCWAHERWKAEIALNDTLADAFGIHWLDLRNRHERLEKTPHGSRVCLWQDSSFLTLSAIFPAVGGRLLRRGLRCSPLRFADSALQMDKTCQPNISVILPVGGRDRIGQFRCVVRAFCGQSIDKLDIIVVEHSRTSDFRSHCPPGVRYALVSESFDGEFNKGLTFNEGVRLSSAPYVLLHDADIIPSHRYVEKLLRHLMAGWDAIRPLRFIFLLDREQSEDFIKADGHALPAKVRSVQQNFPGASTAMSREAFESVGGFDEHFAGWGGEDLEFNDRLATQRLFPGGYDVGVHLWHPPSPKKASGDRNNDLMRRIRALPVGERITALRRGSGLP